MDHIQRLVDAGAKDGTLVVGGHRKGKIVSIITMLESVFHGSETLTTEYQGNFMEFTILLNVPESSPAYEEEIFGPVLIVNTFKDEAAALHEANNTEFGLFCKKSLHHVSINFS